MHLLGNVLVFYVYKKKCFASPDFSYIFMTERIMDSIYQKKKPQCYQFVHGDCNGTIDMHFILLVYKYEYIMNKSSYFLDVVIVWCF